MEVEIITDVDIDATDMAADAMAVIEDIIEDTGDINHALLQSQSKYEKS